MASALELFATHGFAGVPLNAVRATAGAGNRSAVHYHFRTRENLIQAVLDSVMETLAPLQTEALAELATLRAERSLLVNEIVAIGFGPFVALAMGSDTGRMSIRFLSRLTWESGPGAQDMLVRATQPYFLEMANFFKECLPEKPLDALLFHGYLGVNTLIHGLADVTLLARQPLDPVRDLYSQRPEDMLRYFLDYISAGIASKA